MAHDQILALLLVIGTTSHRSWGHISESGGMLVWRSCSLRPLSPGHCTWQGWRCRPIPASPRNLPKRMFPSGHPTGRVIALSEADSEIFLLTPSFPLSGHSVPASCSEDSPAYSCSLLLPSYRYFSDKSPAHLNLHQHLLLGGPRLKCYLTPLGFKFLIYKGSLEITISQRSFLRIK